MSTPSVIAAARAEAPGLAIRVAGERGGPVLATTPVRFADLRDFEREVWWRRFVRRGMTDAGELEFSLRPVVGSSDGDLCRGFVIAARSAGGAEASVTFAMHCLQPIAQRTAEDLRQRDLLGEDGTFYYELVLAGLARDGIARIPPAGATDTVVAGGGQVLRRTQNLQLTDLPLATLVQRSTAVGETGAEQHELFWTNTALERAERIARLGEKHEPAVETGGVLLGYVGYCAGARDAFVVVVDALEAVDAERNEFSLSFSSKTWHQLQTVVRARAARQPGLGILGQTHGHPFSPGEPCAACPTTADCPKHTAFLSEHDRRWARAVFHAQPWQVSQMYGVDAKGTPTSATFGVLDGRLEPRGYRRIDERDFERIQQRTSTGDRT